MDKLKDKHVTDQECWDYCMAEYDSANPVVKALLDGFYGKIAQVVKGLEAADRVLEVGCGAGESSRRILSMLRGQYFEASEYDERFVSRLQQMGQPFKVTQESVYELKRKDKEFDAVFLLEVLEHLEDAEAALKELFRVSRKYVVISVPHEPLWRMLNLARGKYVRDLGNTPGHINHWGIGTLKKLLSKYGSIEQVYAPVPWIIVAVRVKQ